MSEELHWGRDQLALAASLNLILAGLLRPWSASLADRLGSKIVAMTGVALGGSALHADQLRPGALAVLPGVRRPAGDRLRLRLAGHVTTLVSQWFVKRRSLAMSIGSTGTSLGELVTVPLAMLAVLIVGWENAFRVIAGFMLFVVLPVGFFLLYNRPVRQGARAVRLRAGRRPAASGGGGPP